ncbi:hypothetical protein J3R82DRAFT_6194 [Butyriboletus roseoflavus]|nr:hypothetical protein J3R82DRAFT_6194 [Butyriboletus roseoflavus]
MAGITWHYVLKFIITGDAAVGKSSLLVRLTDQRFMTNPDPTLGVEFGSKLIEIPEQGKIIKLQCEFPSPLEHRHVGIRPGPNPFARSHARITEVLQDVC